MSVATKTIKIDLWRALLEPIKVVQREAAGRTLAFQITDGGAAYDLTGKVVTFYATKPDGTTIFNAVTVVDEATGKINYTMTSQTVVVAGALVCTLIITAASEETRTQPFTVTIVASPDYTSAVESADEFTAFTDAAGIIAAYEGRLDTAEDDIDALGVELASVVSGSPAGNYASLAALNAANPDHSRIYITLDDGFWCYYNGSAFVAGRLYQSTSDHPVVLQHEGDLGRVADIIGFPRHYSKTLTAAWSPQAIASQELSAGNTYSIVVRLTAPAAYDTFWNAYLDGDLFTSGLITAGNTEATTSCAPVADANVRVDAQIAEAGNTTVIVSVENTASAFDTLSDNVDKLMDGEYTAIAANTGLSVSILRKLIFLGEFPDVDGTGDTISNVLTNGGTFTSVLFEHERYLDYDQSISGIDDNTELNWIKLVSYSSLVDFDFDNVFVKYTGEPYRIEMIAIAADDASFTDAEKQLLYKAFELPIFRDATLNINGTLKQNRKFDTAAYANLVLNPAFANGDNWTLSGVWTIADSAAYCNDPSMTNGSMTQTYVFEVGTTYRLGFKIKNYVSGRIVSRIDYDAEISDYVDGNYYCEMEFTYAAAGAHPNEIGFRPVEGYGFVGKIEFVELAKL